MNEQLQPVSTWLNTHTNESILIEKREQGDLDQVRLNLKSIGFRGARIDQFDNYMSGSAIILHGSGAVINDQQEMPLPENIFEIPVSRLSAASVMNDRLELVTDRASYSLILQ